MKAAIAVFIAIASARSTGETQSTGKSDHSDLLKFYGTVEGGNLDEVKAVVKNDPSILTKKLETEGTALHMVALLSTLDILKFVVDEMVEKKLSISERDDVHGFTPLHYAVQEKNVDFVQYLVEHGAGISVKDKEGDTPLHFAVLGKNVELVRLLVDNMVDNGAGISEKDKKGKTPLDFANELLDGNVKSKIQNILESHLRREQDQNTRPMPRHLVLQD